MSRYSTGTQVLLNEWAQESTRARPFFVDAYHVESAIIRPRSSQSAWLSSRPDKLQTRLALLLLQASIQALSGEHGKPPPALHKQCLASSEAPIKQPEPHHEILLNRSAFETALGAAFRRYHPTLIVRDVFGHQTHLPQPSACASIHLLTCSIHAE
jgi:hypothetical protein